MAFTPEMRAKALETTRRKAAERRAEKAALAQGVGESRIFAAPEGAFPDNPLLDCHVAGVRVRDLPLEAQGRILYQQTDEGIAEYNRGKVDAAARVSEGPLDKQIQERRDFRSNQLEPWEAPDPMKQLADRHLQPGQRGKFLSPDRCKSDGTRGFEPVIDPKTGDPVRLGTLILAQMPEEKAEQRNEFYRAKANEALAREEAEFMSNQEREMRDAGYPTAGALRPGKRSGREPEPAIGIRVSRGNYNELTD